MKVLIINCILTTAEHGIIKRKESISDCMISNFARGFIELGHTVTLLASEEFRPTGNDEDLPFEVIYFPSRLPQVFKPSLLPWPKGLRQWLKANAEGYDLVIASESFQVSSLIAARACPRLPLTSPHLAGDGPPSTPAVQTAVKILVQCDCAPVHGQGNHRAAQ